MFPGTLGLQSGKTQKACENSAREAGAKVEQNGGNLKFIFPKLETPSQLSRCEDMNSPLRPSCVLIFP